MKLCEECFCRAANIHLMQIVGTAQQSVYLCEECARKHGISISLGEGIDERGLSLPQEQDSESAVEDRECSGCGMKFSEFSESGRLGCPSCYGTFETEITAIHRRFDDAVEYRGKRYRQEPPVRRRKVREDRALLQHELENAVRNEEFERAAFLRDAIDHLEKAEKE